MAFEKFTKTGRGYIPKASIWMRGQIGFNQGAVERYELKEYQYAVLYFDRDERKIGIKFTNDKTEEGTMKIVFSKTGAFISAKAFLDYYNIDRLETRQYLIKDDKESGLYIFEL